MTQEPSKRIVSKGKYPKTQGQRAFIEIIAFGLWILAVLCGLLAILFLYISVASLDNSILSLSIMLLLAGGYFALLKLGCKAMEMATPPYPGIPRTRANTANLPASDSLVRASQEPLQAQVTVLLRPAIETTQRQEEQLLRASTSKESQE